MTNVSQNLIEAMEIGVAQAAGEVENFRSLAIEAWTSYVDAGHGDRIPRREAAVAITKKLRKSQRQHSNLAEMVASSREFTSRENSDDSDESDESSE